jgi:hypothetical protein
LLRKGRELPHSFGLLRARDERLGRRAPGQLDDELASFQLIELHPPRQAWAGLQDIELAMVSQRVSRFFAINLVLTN